MSNPFGSFFSRTLHLTNFLDLGKNYKRAFRVISNILKNRDLRMNSKIILSSKWILKYLSSTTKEDKILNLAIAFEVLLLDNDNLKRVNLAERTSFLLYEKKKYRQKTYKIINDFYLLRNDLVHGGILKNNFRESFLRDVFELYRRVLDKVINKKFASVEEIDKFVQGKKFS